MQDHHAILLVGVNLAETGFLDEATRADSELEFFPSEVLAIGEVRKIIAAAYNKPFAQAVKTIVIETTIIAIEAQQALLKILEEPPVTTKFIIVIKSRESLLPTLLSRLSQPQWQHRIEPKHNELFSMFLKSSVAARLEMIARMTKDKDNTSLNAMRQGVMTSLEEKKYFAEATILAYCLNKLVERGASKKMLLEEIALTLPVDA